MSWQATSWAVSLKLPPIAKLVLLVLANSANKLGECYPGQQSIAADVGISVRSARNWIIWLEGEGYITRHRRDANGGGRSSDNYTLHLDTLPAKSAARRKLPTGNSLPHRNCK